MSTGCVIPLPPIWLAGETFSRDSIGSDIGTPHDAPELRPRHALEDESVADDIDEMLRTTGSLEAVPTPGANQRGSLSRE